MLPLLALACCTQSAGDNNAAEEAQAAAERSKGVAAYDQAFNCYRALSYVETLVGPDDPHIWDRATLDTKVKAARDKLNELAPAAGKTSVDVVREMSGLTTTEKWDADTRKRRIEEAKACGQ